jgi:hypothetical protein
MADPRPEEGDQRPQDSPPADPGEAAVGVRLSSSTLDAVRAVQQYYAQRLAALCNDDPPPAE